MIFYNFQVNPDYKGVCHIALAQEGHCRPGEVQIEQLSVFFLFILRSDCSCK